MEIILLAIGKTTQSFIQKGIEEYLNRLRRYISFRIEILSDIKCTKSLSEELQKEKEGDLILSFVNSSDLFILLDEKGKEFTSKEFSTYLQKIIGSGKKRAVFAIGGPYGFSKSVYERADQKLSLSKMTFTHEMIRLFFIEQIYRGFTILRGEPYHHE
ncbi:MAG: 23S rRNA (pseudouridine(1915)-N(3))-methyltransferase RlmH [Muribaculaceae bacterium]|nr:23S rRNA (pseudouridine(1915)-N(3))-methyltransferase RlmH [Muribaculaceae bacterium]